MKNRFLIPALVGVAFIISGCADPAPTEFDATELGPSLASATQTPVSGTIIWTGGLVPGDIWVTKSGTVHRRNWYFTDFIVAGNLNGTAVFELNSNWTSSGTGSTWGETVMEATWLGKTGTYAGQCTIHVTEYFGSTPSCVLHGSGDFEGMKLQIAIVGPVGGPFTYDGRILDPHGG